MAIQIGGTTVIDNTRQFIPVTISAGSTTGTSGQVLQSTGTGVVWSTPSSAGSSRFNVGITSIVSATITGIGTTVLTLPSTAGKDYIIHSIFASNVAAGNTDVNVIGAFDFNNGQRSYFAYNIPIPTGLSVELLKQPQVLNPSDRITMRATDINRDGVDNSVQIYVSYEVPSGSNYFGTGVAIGVTTPVGVYTSTTYPSVLQSIRLVNRTDTGPYPASVTVTSGVTTTFLIENLIVPKYASIELLETPKAIKTDDIIRVTANEIDSIDVQISGIKVV